jgi:WD40 repeat protein
VPFAHSPVFSPDGTQVAFLASSSATDTGGRLLVAAFDGSAPLIDAGHGLQVVAGQVPSVTWSPDGTRLAFAARLDGVSRIYVTASVGGAAVAVTDGSADADLPTWSPEGDRIAFRVTESGGAKRHLMTVQPDGSGLELLNTVIGTDSSLSKPRFAPANGQLAYAVNFGFGTQTRALIDWGFTHTAEMWTNGIGGLPDAGIPFSPDGRFLAFISATDGVVIADDATSIGGAGAAADPYHGTLHRLGNVADCWIEWVPDGKALYGGSPDGCTGVVVIPLIDPNVARRLPTATSGFASWQQLLP